MDRVILIAILLIISGLLFLSNQRGWITDLTLSRLTNVATVVGLILATLVLLLPNTNENISAPTSTAVQFTNTVDSTRTSQPTNTSMPPSPTNTVPLPTDTPRPTTTSTLISPSDTPTRTPVPTVAVYRWWHEGDKDWVTSPENSYLPSFWINSGYDATKLELLFYAWEDRIPNGVAVYRWWHEGDKDWVTIPENMGTSDHWYSLGYETPIFMFYASTEPIEGGVAVNRWWHPTDKDWVDVPAGLESAVNLVGFGYKDPPEFLFYALKAP